MINEEKQKALEAALGHIEKQYGKGSVMKLGDSSSNMVVEAVPTGSLGLDIALGVGGVPKGRIVEIYGPESSGKTTVALHMVAEVQKRGGIAGFIDAEHALDPVYAKNIGVDIDNLYISQPDNGEQALETTTGGRALKFYASVRLDVRRTETLKQGGEMVGNHVKVKVVKNKVAPPFKQAEFDIMFGTGISREGEILDLASECNVVNKSGAWYSYNGERIGQGRENVKIFLKDHPEICEEIEKQVRIQYHLLPEEEAAQQNPAAQDAEEEQE